MAGPQLWSILYAWCVSGPVAPLALSPVTGLNPGCLPFLCMGPGMQATPHRHWLWPPSVSGPGHRHASVARKKARGGRASGQGHSGPWVSNACISVPSGSSLSGSDQGRSSPRHTFPDREPQVCRPLSPNSRLFRASSSGTKGDHGLPEAQAFLRLKRPASPE